MATMVNASQCNVILTLPLLYTPEKSPCSESSSAVGQCCEYSTAIFLKPDDDLICAGIVSCFTKSLFSVFNC